jgi:hypothetical protein
MNRPRRAIAAIAAGVLAAGIAASAATLGGIVDSDLGADTTVIASCDTDGVTLNYTTAYDATDARYEVTAANVGDIATPSCDGQTLSVTLSDTTGAELGSGSVTVSGATATVTMPGVDAEAVTGAAILIAS